MVMRNAFKVSGVRPTAVVSETFYGRHLQFLAWCWENGFYETPSRCYTCICSSEIEMQLSIKVEHVNQVVSADSQQK